MSNLLQDDQRMIGEDTQSSHQATSLFHSPVLVLGPMRSGTSLVASILQECGLWLGKSIPPSAANPKGFFENAYFKERITKRILGSMDADPRGVDPLPILGVRGRLPGLEAKITSWLERESWPKVVPWGVKDPKLSLIWKSLDEAFPLARWVVVRRPLDEIVRSCIQTPFLSARNQPETFWRTLAESYVDRLAELIDSSRSLFIIEANDILNEQWGAIEDCIKALDLSWKPDRVKRLIDRGIWNTPFDSRRERIQWHLAGPHISSFCEDRKAEIAVSPTEEVIGEAGSSEGVLFEKIDSTKEHHFLKQRLVQPPCLFTSDGHVAPLADLYQGRAAFLLCSGPSLTSHNLSLLSNRGILTMSVNNAATVFRTQLWVSVDTAGNFADAIWKDPGITKFVPKGNLEHRIVIRTGDDQLVESADTVRMMPNIFCFERNSDFQVDRWLAEPTFNYGNRDDLPDNNGDKGGRSVLYVAIKLLYVLGIRTVFLVGCDFRMAQGVSNYAFEQHRDTGAIEGNNRTYEVFARRMSQLIPQFESVGFRLFNCTQGSSLSLFSSVPFEDAIRFAQKEIPRNIVTRGMYDRRWHQHQARGKALGQFLHDEVTLVVSVTENQWSTFLLAWRTWMAAFSAIRHMQILIIYDQRISLLGNDLATLSLSPRINLQSIRMDSSWDSLAEANQAALRLIASEVRTHWFLHVAPFVVASKRGLPLSESLLKELQSNRNIAYAGPSLRLIPDATIRAVSRHIQNTLIASPDLSTPDCHRTSGSMDLFYCYLGKSELVKEMIIPDVETLTPNEWNALFPVFVSISEMEHREVAMTSCGWEPIANDEYLKLRVSELMSHDLCSRNG